LVLMTLFKNHMSTLLFGIGIVDVPSFVGTCRAVADSGADGVPGSGAGCGPR
jgi:hypothetical protein